MNRTAQMIIAGIVIIALLWKGKQVMNRKAFEAKFKAAFLKADKRGFRYKPLISVASYESGDGSGNMAYPGNNIFSLQAGKSWKGKTQLQKSTGNLFRVYDSYEAAINDFIGLLIAWPSNYGPATEAARAGDVEAFAKALQSAPKPYGDKGPIYVAELINRSKAFNT